MADMIHEYGGHNYSIFIDEETNILFGYIELDDAQRYAESANTEICKKWWDFMASVMETNEDNSRFSVDLPVPSIWTSELLHAFALARKRSH